MPIYRRAFLKSASLLALAALVAGSFVATAQTAQQAIEARLKGKPLYLRGQWAPNDLKFDLAGTTASPSISAPFTLCGIDVKKVQLTDQQLEITGDRVGLEFDEYTPRRVSLHKKIQISIAGSPASDYGPSLDKIFANGLAELVPSMPFYWQAYAEAHLLPQSQSTVVAPHRPFAFAHPPQVIEQVEPVIPDAARNLPYQGISLVGIVIEKDGSIHEPHIVRPAGLGLDEEALRAVARYRFKPATDTAGKPVATPLNIEVNFRIGY